MTAQHVNVLFMTLATLKIVAYVTLGCEAKTLMALYYDVVDLSSRNTQIADGA